MNDLTEAWGDLLPPRGPEPALRIDAPMQVGDVIFQRSDGRPFLRISSDGTMQVDPTMTPDEATTAFLLCLQDRWASLVVTERLALRMARAKNLCDDLGNASRGVSIEYHNAIYAMREPREAFETHIRALARQRPEEP